MERRRLEDSGSVVLIPEIFFTFSGTFYLNIFSSTMFRTVFFLPSENSSNVVITEGSERMSPDTDSESSDV